jgi:hypothetical protein
MVIRATAATKNEIAADTATDSMVSAAGHGNRQHGERREVEEQPDSGQFDEARMHRAVGARGIEMR